MILLLALCLLFLLAFAFNSQGAIVTLGVCGALALLALGFYLIGMLWLEYSFKDCLIVFVALSFVFSVFVGWTLSEELQHAREAAWRQGRDAALRGQEESTIPQRIIEHERLNPPDRWATNSLGQR